MFIVQDKFEVIMGLGGIEVRKMYNFFQEKKKQKAMAEKAKQILFYVKAKHDRRLERKLTK